MNRGWAAGRYPEHILISSKLTSPSCPTFRGKLKAECQESRPLAGPHEAHGCASTWVRLGSAGEHALALLCAT